MSGILSRLKGERSLFAKLQESYPTETIQPYGEVLIISGKSFKNEWKKRLEAEGVKTYVTSHNGQTAFFLRKVEQKKQNQTIEESSIPVQKPEPDSEPLSVKEKPVEIAEKEPVPVKKNAKPWTVEERKLLQQLLNEKVPIKDIAEKLQRSTYSVGAEVRVVSKPQLKSKEKHEAKKPQQESSEETSVQGDPNLLKELLESSLVLCNLEKKRACMILLREANKILENR